MKFIPGKLVNQVFGFVFLLAIWVMLGGTAMAQNQYYVNASSGSDSNDGSQARPWKTIQHADAALTLGSGGTTVHVAPGTYSGPITTSKSGTASARIVWISDVKWAAKITTSNWSENGSFVDVNGFDMTSPATGNNFGIGVSKTQSVHILNNYMHGFNLGGCGQFGTINTDGASSDVWIIANIVRDGGNYSLGTNNCVTQHGIYDHAKRTVVENNIISGIVGFGYKKTMDPAAPGPSVVSGNTIFNNGGGILVTEQDNNGVNTVWDFNTISNNIIVNNGTDAPNGGRFGINFYHITGTHNLVTNNLIYGNKPNDYAHHDVACTGGTPISGSDADGTAGGCPSTNPKSDATPSVTFINFQSDTNTSPASNYNPDSYQIKAGSNAIQNGTTSCASFPGMIPCVPATDFVGVARLSGPSLDIGAYEQGSVAGVPAAPTGLTASVQ